VRNLFATLCEDLTGWPKLKMYIGRTSNRTCRRESLGPRTPAPVRQLLSRSDQPSKNHADSDAYLAMAGPGKRRPPTRNRGSISHERNLLSPRRRHWPTARRTSVPEWEQSAPVDAGGCCVYLKRVVSQGGSLTLRAAASQNQWAEPANVQHSRLADHFACLTFLLPTTHYCNPLPQRRQYFRPQLRFSNLSRQELYYERPLGERIRR
jgi:hypothetical protein